MTEELEVIISGRVQMVMFRDFATRKAKKLGIVGFVKNNDDGTVTAIAQGERKLLERYLSYLRRGPLFARVTNVETRWGIPREQYNNFSIRY